MVFFGGARTEAVGHAGESPALMTTPLVILAVLAAIGGAVNLPFGNLNFLTVWLRNSVVNVHIPAPGEGFSVSVAIISTVLALAAIGLSYVIYGRKPLAADQADPLAASGPLFTFLNHKWYWDELYAAVVVQPFIGVGKFLADVVDWRFWHDYVHDTVIAQGLYVGWSKILSQPVDKGLIDGAFDGLGKLVRGSSGELRRTQTGYVRNYALAVALGVVVILAYLLVVLLK
jgi:NADH-quinone oxidoreductase subunit L